MLKAQVGYSVKADSYEAGLETAQAVKKECKNAKVGFIFTSYCAT